MLSKQGLKLAARADPVAHHATEDRYLDVFMESLHTKKILEVKNYRNTDFVHVILQRQFYSRIEKLALRIGTTAEAIINKTLTSSVMQLEKIALRKRITRVENAISVEEHTLR